MAEDNTHTCFSFRVVMPDKIRVQTHMCNVVLMTEAEKEQKRKKK